jgi:hypothetical protein
VREKTEAYLREIIIEQLNNLFGADTTDQDQLVYVNHVIKGKLLESEKLRQQARNNTKEQFANACAGPWRTRFRNAVRHGSGIGSPGTLLATRRKP